MQGIKRLPGTAPVGVGIIPGTGEMRKEMRNEIMERNKALHVGMAE